MKLVVQASHPSLDLKAKTLTAELGLTFIPSGKDSGCADYSLRVDQDSLSLLQLKQKNMGAVKVDFDSGAVRHRRTYGGGKGQQIAKAVGLSKGVKPSVLDCTAGLGRDAFVLASMGCYVSMVERQNVVRMLLADGLTRAASSADQDLVEIVARMNLIAGDSVELVGQYLPQSFDVLYLDPMFPGRSKSALVKKEMRFFHDLVGGDVDADQLLLPALRIAKHRVVVKRPAKAEYLADHAPSFSLSGKSARYDIYALRSF